MAGYRPARGGVLETMEDFYKRRQREVTHFGEEAAAAARDAYPRPVGVDSARRGPAGADTSYPPAPRGPRDGERQGGG